MKKVWCSLIPALSILLGLAFTFTPIYAQVTITLVGTATNTTASATTTTATLTQNVTAGSSIILGFTMRGRVGAVSATDAAANTYSVDVLNQLINTEKSAARSVILSAHNVSALTTGQTITVTHPALGILVVPPTSTLSVLEVTGLAANPLDQTSQQLPTFSSSQTTGTTAQTLFHEELLISVFAHDRNPGVSTPGAGQTIESTLTAGSTLQGVVTSQQVSAKGTFEHTTTTAGGTEYSAVLATYALADQPPGFGKSFSPAGIISGGVSTLTFTIANTANTDDATSLAFTDNLPAGMVVASPANASVTCTGGTLTATAGSGTISYTSGTLSAGTSCTIQVDVTSATAGTYNNTSGELTSSLGNSGDARAILTVISRATPGVCYATTGRIDGGRFYTVNTATGAATLIDDIAGYSFVPGLAINSQGEIFATEIELRNLLRLDAATGAPTVVGSLSGIYEGIAFDASDVLYGVEFSTGNVVTINTTTAATTVVGNTGVGNLAGLAFDPTTNILYGSRGNGFDEIYTINTTTGAATLLGATGIPGSTPDLMFDAAGTLFGSKGGGGTGTGDLITINKTTGAGTVVGSFGITAVSGLACYHPPSTVKPFVFLANKITLESTKQVPSYGDMHSNGTLTVNKGDNSTYYSNLTAVGKITIGKYNIINGDVTSQTSISNSGKINGTKTIGAVNTEPLPNLSYSAGGPNETLANGGSLSLAPGSYGIVTLNENSTLKLTSGEYFMDELRYSSDIENGVIEIDLSSGNSIVINIVSNFEFGHEAAIVLLPNGESDSKLVTFNTLQTTDADWGREGYLVGSFNAPNAVVTLVKNTQLRGAICAKEIYVSTDCLFLHHDSPGSLPGPGNLPKPSESEVATSEVVTDYALEQNYPNPFSQIPRFAGNPSTTISFALPEAGEVSLSIYNTNGQLVKKLVTGEMEAGRHSVVWDATNARGERVASGVYLYLIKAGEFTAHRKLVLMK